MAKQCSVCNKALGIMTGKAKLSNGDYVCTSCMKSAGLSTLVATDLGKIRTMTSNQIQQKIKMRDQGKNVNRSFSATEKCGSFAYFDDLNKIGLFNTGTLDLKPKTLISYEEISNFEAIEDNDQIIKSGLGLAAAGGVLFGPAGAIVGAITGKGKKGKNFTSKLQVVVVLKSGQRETINLISSKVKHSSFTYKGVQPQFEQLIQKLEYIVNESHSFQKSMLLSPTDEIRKYKALLDDGIISQEEFDKKKLDLLRK